MSLKVTQKRVFKWQRIKLGLRVEK
jgi:hypothetical protein